MEKTIIILSIIFTLIFVGILHGTQKRTSEEPNITSVQASVSPYSYQMPKIVMNSMLGYPRY